MLTFKMSIWIVTVVVLLRRRAELFLHVCLDVYAADGAFLVRVQPLVDARHVEEVHARQTPHLFFLLELAQADRALVILLSAHPLHL